MFGCERNLGQDQNMQMNKLLKRPSRQLAGLLDTIDDLKVLSGVVMEHLDSAYADHYRLANYRQGELVLTTHSTAWATRMRYLIPELLKKLQEEPVFEALKSISCRVDLVMDAKAWALLEEPSPTVRLRLTSQTRSLLKRVAESLHSSELKKAFLRLAKEE